MNEKPVNPIDELSVKLQAAAENLRWENALKPKGFVIRVGDGVAMVRGLNDVAFEELVQFENGCLGMAYDLDEQRIGIVILTDPDKIHEDQGVVGLDRLPEFPVGQHLLGKIIDSLGKPLD